MKRRTFLAWATGGLGGVAGCASVGDSDSGEASGTTATPTEGTPTETVGEGATPTAQSDGDIGPVKSVAGVDLPLPKSKMSRGAELDAIPAITDPAFAADWSGLELTYYGPRGAPRTIEPRLNPDDEVIAVSRSGTARAYPLRVMNWHEVVNDTLDGPLLVSYCPLCGSPVTARRTVDGEPTMFGVSGLLWNSNLMLYDELTGSLWSQLAATAVRGPETGERLTLVPSTLTTWGEWQRHHPDTDVLLPPPESTTVMGKTTRNYNVDPYEVRGYYETGKIGLGNNDVPEDEQRIHPKTQVLGIAADGSAKAYPLPEVRETGVVNDRVGDLPVVVAVAADDTTLVSYVRRVNGSTPRFERSSESHMRAAGSRWEITTGEAVDGPHEGTTLDPATKTPTDFWFAWLDFHPDSKLYRTDRGDGQ